MVIAEYLAKRYQIEQLEYRNKFERSQGNDFDSVDVDIIFRTSYADHMHWLDTRFIRI
jgi:hypothetical protein